MSKTLKKTYARPECLVVSSVFEPILVDGSATLNQPTTPPEMSKENDWVEEESQNDWSIQSYDE